MNDLIKRIDDYMQGAGEEVVAWILTDCRTEIESLRTALDISNIVRKERRAELQRLLLANETLVALNAEYAERIKALEAHGIAPPEGMVLVPIEPTLEMKCAGGDLFDGDSFYWATKCYKLMVAVAPKQENSNE